MSCQHHQIAGAEGVTEEWGKGDSPKERVLGSKSNPSQSLHWAPLPSSLGDVPISPFTMCQGPAPSPKTSLPKVGGVAKTILMLIILSLVKNIPECLENSRGKIYKNDIQAIYH